MEPTFELDPEQKQIKQKIFPYLKALAYELVLNQPQQIEKYMIDFLCKQGNYTTSGLTKDETKELELLRVTVKHYRDLEKHSLVNSQKELDIKKDVSVNSDNSYSEENDDVMDDKEEEEIKNKLINIKKSQENQNSMRARISVSAEAYGLYNKKRDFVPKVIPKNEDQMNRIKGKIISSFIFSSLDKKDLEVVINAMEEKRYKINENVITQGEDGDCLYIVETGLLKCYKTFKPGDPPKFLKNYESGDSFGELALLYNCPRAATIVCSSEESIIWSLDRETFNNIVKDAAQKKREKYENFLKNVDILSTIDSYELGQICDSLKDGVYKKDDYIIKEGELGDVFYIIEEGHCNATKTFEPGKPETVINTLKEGDYFGERALIRGEPRYANIIVSSETAKVISLDRRSFNRLLGPIMDILKRNIDKYQTYANNNDKNASSSNYMSKSTTNSNINSNIASKNNLNSLNNIITSDNNDKINLIDNSVNDNNPINIPNNDLNNKTNVDNNNDENQTNYANIDVNKNLNEIISSDNNNINTTNIENNNNENQTNNDTDVNKNMNHINISENNDINNNTNIENNNNENPANNDIEINKNLNDIITSNNNINENTNEKIEDNTNNNEKNENEENQIIINEENKDIDDNQNNNNENNNNENLDNTNNNKEENENNKLPSLMDALTSNNNVENIVNSDNNNIVEISEKKENKVYVGIKDNKNKNDENIESMKDNSTQIENKNEETDPKQELQPLTNMLIYQNNEETEKEN